MEDQEFSASSAADPLAIEVAGSDVRGVVFVIPLDAPLPNELADINVPTGSLYKRLAALDGLAEGAEVGFVPVSGNELLALGRVWHTLVAAPKVAVLYDLPGARYDIVFTQAEKQIGLRSVDWPAVSEALGNRLREVQRTKDTEPWQLEQAKKDAGLPSHKRPLKAPRRTDLSQADNFVAPPPEDDYEDKDSNQA